MGDIPTFKKFNGKKYKFHSWSQGKHRCIGEAKKIRSKGYYARVVKSVMKGHAVYKRRKSTFSHL